MTRALPSWVPIIGAPGWTVTNLGAYGSPWRVPAFRYDPATDFVELRGLLTVTAAAPSLGVPPKLAQSGGGEIGVAASSTSAGGTGLLR